MHERRVFLTLSGKPEELVGKEVSLGESESKHLATVLRISVGDPVTIVDSVSGTQFQSFVTSVNKSVTVKLDHRLNNKEYKSVVSTLAVGMCKQAATELIIEKATELGVGKIALILSDHSVIKLKDSKDIESKKLRFAKIAQSASQQSSRTSIPNIDIYAGLNQFLAEDSSAARFVGSLEGDAKIISEVLTKDIEPSRGICVLIGPEGDFSASEIALLKDNEASFFSLGGNRLRSETAAVAAIAAFDAIGASVR